MYGHISPDPRIYGDSGYNSPPYYSTSKGALLQYTRYAACHLGSMGIRVNSISPGPFPPIRVRKGLPEFFEQLERKVPLGRVGRAVDIVGPVVFLASSCSLYVTGTNIEVDGGWTKW